MKTELQDKVQRLWGATIASIENPGLTIHQLPAATKADVDVIYQTLKSTISEQPTMTAPKSVADGLNDTLKTLISPTGTRVLANKGGQGDDNLMGNDCYSMNKLLGSGGMGNVYLARQDSLSRDVAVKTMRNSSDATHMAAFLREALTTAALAHPNIVPVHYFGRDGMDRLFMVMKRVEGRPWTQLIHPEEVNPGSIRPNPNDTPLSTHLEIFQKVCDAITFAHSKKVVHRDLKPDNIMVGDFGEVMLMDWGLALDVSDGRDGVLGLSRDKASVIAGTPGYMSPEMAVGSMEHIGTQTDIYLLGAILYEVVTGKPPHCGRSIYETLLHAADGKYDPIKAREGLPKGIGELERIIKKCLEPNPRDRYETVAALQADIRGFQAGQSDRSGSETLAKEARDALTALSKEVELISVTSPYYPKCADILAKAHQALALWGFNPRAMRVRQEGLALYADLAIRGRDWGLAESQIRDLRLSGSGGASLAQPLDGRLRVAREKWQQREFLLRRTARLAVLVTFAAIGLTIHYYLKWRNAELALENQPQPNVAVAQTPAETTPVIPQPAPLPEIVVDKRPTPLTQTKDPYPFTPKVGTTPPPPTPHPNPAQPVAPPSFAPQSQPPGWIALDPAKPAGPENAARLRGIRLNGNGKVLLWDSGGRSWHWNGRANELPDRPWFEALAGQAITCCIWADANNVLFSDAKGGVYLTPPVRTGLRPLFECRKPVQSLAVTQRNGAFIYAAAGNGEFALFQQGATEAMHDRGPHNVLHISFNADARLQIIHNEGFELAGGEGKRERFEFEVPVQRAMAAENAPLLLTVPRNQLQNVVATPIVKKPVSDVYALPLGNVSCMTVTPDGKYVVLGSVAGELAFTRVGSQQVLSYGQPHKGTVQAVALSADATRLYSIDNSGGIYTWDLSSKKK